MANKKNAKSQSVQGLHGLAALSFERLIRLKESGDPNAFQKHLSEIIGDLRSYVAVRLKDAVKKGQLPSGKYEVADFVDELYIRAFDKIKEVQDQKDLRPWLFQKVDELLDNAIVEEEFNEFFFEDIEKYSQAEWDTMQEDYSVDGDGDLMPLEEFDDPSYPKYEYKLEDVFIENPEEKWIENLNKEVGLGQLHNHIDMVLHKLPIRLRAVYDLAVNQRFRVDEIAKIKRIKVQEVEADLTQAKKTILMSIEQRYSRKDRS